MTPSTWDGESELPGVILLHGFGANPVLQEAYFQMSAYMDERPFFYVMPDGRFADDGRQFWNASAACCDYDNTGVDDVAYLTGLIEEMTQVYPVDARRVTLLGHSNGGYMSYRMACDVPELLAGIASLAGVGMPFGTECEDGVVNVLQMHGTLDSSVSFEDTTYLPGAKTSAADLAERAGCDRASESVGTADYVYDIDGEETDVERWVDGCPAGYSAELWTMNRGLHAPAFTTAYRDDLADWLLSQERVD
jgi:polyhydroxybutyrate depolymerase